MNTFWKKARSQLDTSILQLDLLQMEGVEGGGSLGKAQGDGSRPKYWTSFVTGPLMIRKLASM